MKMRLKRKISDLSKVTEVLPSQETQVSWLLFQSISTAPGGSTGLSPGPLSPGMGLYREPRDSYKVRGTEGQRLAALRRGHCGVSLGRRIKDTWEGRLNL